jgi:hypothetical protein
MLISTNSLLASRSVLMSESQWIGMFPLPLAGYPFRPDTHAFNSATGQPRGFAHADFLDVDSAVKAKEKLQGVEIFGRRLRVDYSDQKNIPRRDNEMDSRGRSGDLGQPAMGDMTSNPDGSY